MYKIEFRDSSYNRLEFVCKDTLDVSILISCMYRHTTDEKLTFTGTQIIPEEAVPEGFEKME